jgi:hypothetical protein
MDLDFGLLSDFDGFVFVFYVQFFWELNPNKAKSLEFKGCAKLGTKKKGAFKNIKGRSLVLSKKGPPFVFS